MDGPRAAVGWRPHSCEAALSQMWAAGAPLRALLLGVPLLLAEAHQASARRALGQQERAVSFVAALATQGAQCREGRGVTRAHGCKKGPRSQGQTHPTAQRACQPHPPAAREAPRHVLGTQGPSWGSE